MSARSKAKSQLPATRNGATRIPAPRQGAVADHRTRRARAGTGGQGLRRPTARAQPRRHARRDRHQAGEALPGRGDGQRRRRRLRGRLPRRSARWPRCRRSRARRWCSSRRRRCSCWPSPRCTAFPPSTGSAVAPWCWRCSSARTASTRSPTCSAPAVPAAPGCPTARRRCRCPRCRN